MIFTSNDSNLDLALDFSVFPESFEGLSKEALLEYVYTLEEYEYHADYMENNLVYPPLRAIRAKLEAALGYKLETDGCIAPIREEQETEVSADEPIIFVSNDPHLDLTLDMSVFPDSFQGLGEEALREYVDILEDYFYKADYMLNSLVYQALRRVEAKLIAQLPASWTIESSPW